MIQSVRSQLPKNFPYEIIVVDGGSSDGTQDYVVAQHDCKLIQHGSLLGAIKAFGDGARAASGQYVLLANDDITFKPFSILAALAHLEHTPTCGAVAFADNRTSKVTGNGQDYRTEGIGATTPDGQKTMVTYAQVGLFRKWLGDQCGWWGDQDPIMSKARTYGGDSYLSARIWEAGYSVDPVYLAVVEDHIVRDALRQFNARLGPKDGSYFYERFKTVKLPALPATVDDSERLLILHLPIYEQGYPGRRNKEAGLTEALQEYGLTIEWDYLNEPVDLIQLVRAWQPHLLITQIQGVGRITPYMLASFKHYLPSLTIVNWNGDAHEEGLISPKVLELLKYVDLQTTVNAKVLPFYAEHGIKAAYWQIGYKDPVDPLPVTPAHEVLFQGNCYNTDRDNLIMTLKTIRPSLNLGLYGNCRGSAGNSHYSFAMQRALYSRATITVGDTFHGTEAFVSNRVFQALSSGAFLLQQYSKNLEQYTGLKPGIHYVEWTSLADLRAKILHWIKPSQTAARQKISRAGCQFVRENFSYPAQVRKLFQLLSNILE